MNYDEYRELVQGLEVKAKRSPGGYRLRVLMLAAFGFAVVGATVFLIFGLVGGVGLLAFMSGKGIFFIKGLKVIIPLALVGFGILRATWMTVPPPDGVPLRRAEHPKLFESIDRVRTPLGVAEPDVVLLDSDLNAGVSEVPRFGLFPIYRTYLVLGLPLLEAMSVEELEAVLAHEFGHLSGQHGRTSSWIYRVRRTWFLILGEVERRGTVAGSLIQKFVEWYVPRIGAWAFPLARQDEYAADADAARVTSAQTIVDALVRSDQASATADERFWNSLDDEIKASPTPPRGAFGKLASLLHAPPESKWSQERLTGLVGVETEFHDTHPSLSDRAAALGVEPRVPPAVEIPAAEALLEKPQFVRERLSAQWYERVAPAWQAQHESLREATSQLEELEGRVADLTLDEQTLRANLALRLERKDIARDALSVFLDLPGDPRHAESLLELGKLELEDNPDEAVGLIERAVEASAALEQEGAAILAAHFQGRDKERYEHWVRRMHGAAERDMSAAVERSDVRTSDELKAHGLSVAQEKEIQSYLLQHDDVKQAWIAEKVLEQYQERAFYVVAIEISSRFAVSDEGLADDYTRICQEIVEALPAEGAEMVVAQVNTNPWLKKKMKKVAMPLL